MGSKHLADLAAFENSTTLPSTIYIDAKWLKEMNATLDDPEPGKTVMTADMVNEKESLRKSVKGRKHARPATDEKESAR